MKGASKNIVFCSNEKLGRINYSVIKKEATMAGDFDYAKMIEIPLNTCEYQPKKKRTLFKKKRVISSVNEKLTKENLTENNENLVKDEENISPTALNSDQADNNDKKEGVNQKNLPAVIVSKKEKIKNAIISAQVVAVFALISAIILTNVFWENSGMNTLFKSVFGSEQVKTDSRTYGDFSLYLPVKSEQVSLDNGVIQIEGEYSLYPVCEGKVSKVEKQSDGTYTLTIKHSDSFLSVIEGVNLVYFSVGEEVFKHLPVGYCKQSAKVYLYEKDVLLTDYATLENSIVFNK